ncbi:MAG: phage tail protein [Gemmatimonadales bacterium]
MAYQEAALRFRVDWGGKRITFAEINGLRPGAHGRLERDQTTLPASEDVKYEHITFRNGVVSADENDTWEKLESGAPTRRDITVTLLAEGEETVMVWKVTNALLVKVASPDFRASGTEAAIDLLEIAHEGIEVVTAED